MNGPLRERLATAFIVLFIGLMAVPLPYKIYLLRRDPDPSAGRTESLDLYFRYFSGHKAVVAVTPLESKLYHGLIWSQISLAAGIAVWILVSRRKP